MIINNVSQEPTQETELEKLIQRCDEDCQKKRYTDNYNRLLNIVQYLSRKWYIGGSDKKCIDHMAGCEWR